MRSNPCANSLERAIGTLVAMLRDMLQSCEHCEGFLPQGSLACPHCEAGVSRKGRLAMLALGAVSSVTLMACYGAPTDELSCDTQHPELGRTPIAVSDGDQSQEVTLSCGNSSELTYLFTLMILVYSAGVMLGRRRYA